MKKRFHSLILFIIWPLTAVMAADAPDNQSVVWKKQTQTPVIGIIIDDLGSHRPSGERAINIPGALTYSFLPHTSYGRELAIRAHDHDKEVMLHLPMEAVGKNRLGEGGLESAMTRETFINILRGDINSIPYISGINNHMGSLLTQNKEQMAWVMKEIYQNQKLFFVDSMTSVNSVAYRSALQGKIPSIKRNVFLDNERDLALISQQFDKLIKIARRTGSAIAIGHPYPETLAFLEQRLPQLAQENIQLIPISKLIKLRAKTRIPAPPTLLVDATQKTQSLGLDQNSHSH